jgi:hypothetical protein
LRKTPFALAAVLALSACSETARPASFIEGYAGATSINRGEAIELFVSTDGSEFTMEVQRMGWQGLGPPELMTTVPALRGQQQAVPAPDPSTGMIEAGWDPVYELQTDVSWRSGVYIVDLSAPPDATGRIIFVLRDDASSADLLVHIPVTTYQAYNNWGGKSLYDFSSTDSARAHKVSFDRPYAERDGAGAFFIGDYNLIRWLEREGYDATYVTSIDLARDPAVFAGHKVFISNWHDEYWSRPMRDNLIAAQDAGVHSAFFDSNNLYWQVRFESSSDGTPNRVMVAYKEASLDPLAASQPQLTTVRWRDPPVNEPENAILGVMWESDYPLGTSFPWVVRNADHWIYQGTALADGDTVTGLVGYEYDRVTRNGLSPAGLTILAASPVVNGLRESGLHNAVFFEKANGAMVFSAGTNYWPWKLDANRFEGSAVDSRVQLMTRNLLNRMLGR